MSPKGETLTKSGISLGEIKNFASFNGNAKMACHQELHGETGTAAMITKVVAPPEEDQKDPAEAPHGIDRAQVEERRPATRSTVGPAAPAVVAADPDTTQICKTKWKKEASSEFPPVTVCPRRRRTGGILSLTATLCRAMSPSNTLPK